ncbi:MAG: type II secretion system protein [Patescibacteria group bacterium]
MGKSKVGFTLIELLVVIAIIGLLATLSVVALNTARIKARDARRVSDIKQIQTALELFADANTSTSGIYPAALTNLTPTYMGSVPTNPTPTNDGSCAVGATYTYATSSATSYNLSYCLSTGAATATPAGIK